MLGLVRGLGQGLLSHGTVGDTQAQGASAAKGVAYVTGRKTHTRGILLILRALAHSARAHTACGAGPCASRLGASECGFPSRPPGLATARRTSLRSRRAASSRPTPPSSRCARVSGAPRRLLARASHSALHPVAAGSVPGVHTRYRVPQDTWARIQAGCDWGALCDVVAAALGVYVAGDDSGADRVTALRDFLP